MQIIALPSHGGNHESLGKLGGASLRAVGLQVPVEHHGIVVLDLLDLLAAGQLQPVSGKDDVEERE